MNEVEADANKPINQHGLHRYRYVKRVCLFTSSKTPTSLLLGLA